MNNTEQQDEVQKTAGRVFWHVDKVRCGTGNITTMRTETSIASSSP